jgi:hypothetical protein
VGADLGVIVVAIAVTHTHLVAVLVVFVGGWGAVAVAVQSVADLDSTRVDIGVVVVAVQTLRAVLATVPVTVRVAGGGDAVTVVVDSVVRDLGGPGKNGGVPVVAVLAARGDRREAVPVAVLAVFAVTVLVDSVADLVIGHAGVD